MCFSAPTPRHAGLGNTLGTTAKFTAAELMARLCTQAAWLIKWPGRQFMLEERWLHRVMGAAVEAHGVLCRWVVRVRGRGMCRCGGQGRCAVMVLYWCSAVLRGTVGRVLFD